MYWYPATHELSPGQQKTFGLDKVDVLYDGNLNAIVLNQKGNGLLAGSRLLSQIDPHYRSGSEPSNAHRRLRWSLTDDHNAWQMVRLVESRIAGEQTELEQRVGTLAYLGASLPRLQTAEAGVQEKYVKSLEFFLVRDKRVFNDDKKAATAEIESALQHMVDRGHVIPSAMRSHVLHAAGHYAARGNSLIKQLHANRERRVWLEREFRADTDIKSELRALALGKTAIHYHAEDFLELARQRRTKPGALSVNNAWFHRREENSWANYLLAQDGWEEFYGPMMWPMSNLAGEHVKKLEKLGKNAVFGHYVVMLCALDDVIDLSMIGGDYDKLAQSLQDVSFLTQELMIAGNFSGMRKSAETFRRLLRYRVLKTSQQPPPEWYGGLPPKPRPSRNSLSDDPFAGLD